MLHQLRRTARRLQDALPAARCQALSTLVAQPPHPSPPRRTRRRSVGTERWRERSTVRRSSEHLPCRRNVGGQRLATLREPPRMILSRVRCIAWMLIMAILDGGDGVRETRPRPRALHEGDSRWEGPEAGQREDEHEALPQHMRSAGRGSRPDRRPERGFARNATTLPPEEAHHSEKCERNPRNQHPHDIARRAIPANRKQAGSRSPQADSCNQIDEDNDTQRR